MLLHAVSHFGVVVEIRTVRARSSDREMIGAISQTSMVSGQPQIILFWQSVRASGGSGGPDSSTSTESLKHLEFAIYDETRSGLFNKSVRIA
jgi:hypothetical protein